MIEKKRILAIALFLLLTAQGAAAADFRTGDYEPEKFHTTNNLLRTPGGSEYICGEKFIFKGKIVDSAGMPVMNAKIYLWHAACDGKYPYKPMRVGLDKSKINLHNASSFQGSGVAYTDNLGNFTFISVHSTSKKHLSKKLHFRILHASLDDRELVLDLAKIKHQTSQSGTKTYQAKIKLQGSTGKRY